MLKVIFGNVSLNWKGSIRHTSEYFDNMYEPNWLSSEYAKHIIRTIDKSEYIDGEYIQSPVLGGISPRDLSTGCKTLLILLNEPDKIVTGDRMGDNCFPILLDMAKSRDLTVTLCHFVNLKQYEPFDIIDYISGEKVSTVKEFIEHLYIKRRGEYKSCSSFESAISKMKGV